MKFFNSKFDTLPSCQRRMNERKKILQYFKSRQKLNENHAARILHCKNQHFLLKHSPIKSIKLHKATRKQHKSSKSTPLNHLCDSYGAFFFLVVWYPISEGRQKQFDRVTAPESDSILLKT